MQFSDRFVHFSLQLLYSTLRYQNPWTLATFCIGTYTLYNLFTYWYSARFCQGNTRRRTFFQVKKRSEREGSSISPAQGSFSISARLQVDRAVLAAASRKSGAHSSRKRSTCCSQRPM